MKKHFYILAIILFSLTTKAQIITTVAGGIGDNNPATQSALTGLASITLDSIGNIYFVDQINHRVRKINASNGIITTVAGIGIQGFAGDGVLGIWYAKAPGLERAMDALRHGVYGGTGGNNSVILFVGDDPASNSSSIPTSSSNLLADMNIPVIYPGNVDEIIPLSLHAINISRLSGLWTALKITTSVADSFTSLSLNSSQVPLVNLTQYPDHSPLTTALDTTFLGNTNTTERTILQL